ncbi:MAG: hypothetical protein II944_05150 [Ruminobacter sp.]|nr:hypothetical protein [Ruminobacter sp.]
MAFIALSISMSCHFIILQYIRQPPPVYRTEPYLSIRPRVLEEYIPYTSGK